MEIRHSRLVQQHLSSASCCFAPLWVKEASPTAATGYISSPQFSNLLLSLLISRHPPTNFNSSPLYVITAELNPNMFSALCSWTYNLGTGALQRSSLRRLYLNYGRYEEAADELLRWVFCNGKRLRGLVLRRTDERALFLP